MLRCICALLMLFFVATWSVGQSVDYRDLDFHSELEEEVLTATFFEKLPDLKSKVRFLQAVDSTATEAIATDLTAQIEQIVADLQAANLKKKKPLKAAKLLYATVHERLLTKYDEDAQFADIFTSGNYNCVTASALYALVLEELGLPYELHELPTHVYLVYDPAGEYLIVESTAPSTGIFELDKEDIAKELLAEKMISQAEYDRKTADQLYADFIESEDKIIDLRGILSDLYFNAGVLAMYEEHYPEAEALAEKAVYLASNEVKIELWSNSLLVQLDNMLFEKPESFRALFALQYFPDYEVLAMEDLVMNYGNASEQLLIANNKKDQYRTLREYFLIHLLPTATEARAKIDFNHFVQMGRHHGLLEQYEQAYVYLDSAYQLQPDHLQVQSMLRDLVFGNINKKANEEDPYILMDYLQAENRRFPFLKENERFRQLLMFSELAPVIENFQENREEEALAAYEELKPRIASLNDGTEASIMAISEVFTNASSYYFRILDKKEAFRWLEEGLKVLPGNEEILRKRKMLEEYYGN